MKLRVLRPRCDVMRGIAGTRREGGAAVLWGEVGVLASRSRTRSNPPPPVADSSICQLVPIERGGAASSHERSVSDDITG